MTTAWLVACGPSIRTDDAGGRDETTDGAAEDTAEGLDAGDVDSAGPQGDGAGVPIPDDEPVGACCSNEPAEYGCDPLAMVGQCDREVICPRVTVECSRGGADLYDCTNEVVFDEAALTCALEAMRKRVPGQFEIDGTMDFGIFSLQDRHAIWLLGDETVVTAGCMANDVGVDLFGPDRCTLAPPEYFDECLALVEPADRYACLWAGLRDEQPLRVCQ